MVHDFRCKDKQKCRIVKEWCKILPLFFAKTFGGYEIFCYFCITIAKNNKLCTKKNGDSMWPTA